MRGSKVRRSAVLEGEGGLTNGVDFPISNCSVPFQSPRWVVKTDTAEKEAEPLIGNVVAVGFDLRGVLPTASVQNPPTDQDFVDIYSENAIPGTHPQTKVFENCAWVP